MPSSKALHYLATHPQAHLRFLRTGKLPQGVRPRSPLIDLLESIGARERMTLKGLRVDATLGYAGSRDFHNAEQALNWLRPSMEEFGDWPAESWRIKHFNRQITLEMVRAQCASHGRRAVSPNRSPGEHDTAVDSPGPEPRERG